MLQISKLLSGWNSFTAENVTVENDVSGDIIGKFGQIDHPIPVQIDHPFQFKLTM